MLLSELLAKHGAAGYDSIKDLETKLVIFASEADASRIIGAKGHTAAELSKKLGRRVVVLVKGWEKEQIIKSLARPSRVVATNKVFKEGGKEVLKLIFDKVLDEGTIELMKQLIGEVEIDYEEKPYVRRVKR